MCKLIKLMSLTFLCFFILGPVYSQMSKEKTVEVGGAAMYPGKTIVENAVNSADHTTLVAAVKAAGLVDVLNSEGPFTVFAPVNKAFDQLPAGTVETLLMKENQQLLAKVLTYHVVAGSWDSRSIDKLIKEGNGKAEVNTVAGGKLWILMEGKDIIVQDEKMGKAKVTIKDVYQKNGVIHVIDSVLLPQ